MKLITKRLLYSSFILIFFITAPILMLYSSGYRFNFSKLKLEKTGSLVVESIPKNTEIYLNNKLIKTKTPARINYLLPDEYILEIKKNGYFPWKNKILITSGVVTFVKKVYLIKQELPGLIMAGDIISFEKVPNENKFMILQNASRGIQFLVFDADTNSTKPLYSFPAGSEPRLLEWSANLDKLILQNAYKGKINYLIASAKNYSVTDMAQILQQSFEKIKWDNFSNSILYGQRLKELYRIDLAQPSAKVILSDTISDFASFDTMLYYITSSRDSIFLTRKELSENSPTKTVKLPSSTLYNIRLESKDMLMLTSPAPYNSFLLNTKIFDTGSRGDIENNILFEGRAKNIRWGKFKKKFLYYNDFELFVYDLKTSAEKLINRFGIPIIDAQWALSDNNIVYRLKNSLYITDVNFLNENNTYSLSQENAMGNFSLGNRSENALWFYGKIKNANGLYLYTLIPDDDLPFFEQAGLPPLNY